MLAIYARQSADRADSISIDTQADFCIRRTDGDEYQVFADRGYSGGNIHRPAFEKMLQGCRKGVFSKIITYKLDRISRSLADFVLLLEELEKLDIELVSCTESFSSRSEMGVLIMKLLVMFAEMERKNIRSRVKDNYYARGEKGFYLGGYPPFGYEKVPVVLEGKATSGYNISPSQAEVVKFIYRQFVSGGLSASAICAELNSSAAVTSRGGAWTPPTLIRLLRNPFYVMSDWRIYEFFTSQGAVITSPADSFDGVHGCICYGSKADRKGSRFRSFRGEHITVGRHRGIISPEIWLQARSRLERPALSGGGSVKSYLTGLTVCSGCGKKLSVTSSKGCVYLYCRGKKIKSCESGVSVRKELPEAVCGMIVTKRLRELSEISIQPEPSQEENRLRLELVKNRRQLENLKEKLLETSEISMPVFEAAIRELKNNRDLIEKKLAELLAERENLCYTELRAAADCWEDIPNGVRRLIAGEIIEKCRISKGSMIIYLV